MKHQQRRPEPHLISLCAGVAPVCGFSPLGAGLQGCDGQGLSLIGDEDSEVFNILYIDSL